MNKMKQKHQAVLSILLSEKGTAITTRDIWDYMEPAEQGLFGSQNSLSKDLNYMKSHKDLIKNGESEYINGKATFTWLLTDTGKKQALGKLEVTEVKIQGNEQPSDQIVAEIIDPVVESTTDNETVIEESLFSKKIDELVSTLADLRSIYAIQQEPRHIRSLADKIMVLEHCASFFEPVNANSYRIINEIIADLKCE